MKDNKTIIRMNQAIDEKQSQLKEQLKELSDIRAELQEECQHDIVFRLYDNAPRKIGIIYNYYCPTCRKIVTLHMHRTLENSPFKESKVITLDGLNIIDSKDYKEVFDIIQKEVSENYSYYYNKEMITQRLSTSMNGAIKENNSNCKESKQRIIK